VLEQHQSWMPPLLVEHKVLLSELKLVVARLVRTEQLVMLRHLALW